MNYTQSPTLSSTKVTIQTPSAKIIEQQNPLLEKEVTDADGKVYTLSVPNPVDMFDLYAALGSEHAANVSLIGAAMPLLFLEKIDGAAFTRPGTYNEIRFALKRLGTNGIKAISKAMGNYLAKEQEEQGDKESLKK